MTIRIGRLPVLLPVALAVLMPALLVAWAGTAAAGKATVVKATATVSSYGGYTFTASVAHADTGWKHYANKFEILSPDGTVLGTRVLAHPHVDEQPFTRGTNSIKIPPGITSVIVRAWDNIHKAGEKTFNIKLPGR